MEEKKANKMKSEGGKKSGKKVIKGGWKKAVAPTFLLWRWMSPMELATVLGPSSILVLRGHSVLTRWCSPIKILRTFSAPVTRTSGRPSKCVLNTFPYFSRREDWKQEPCGGAHGGLGVFGGYPPW